MWLLTWRYNYWLVLNKCKRFYLCLFFLVLKPPVSALIRKESRVRLGWNLKFLSCNIRLQLLLPYFSIPSFKYWSSSAVNFLLLINVTCCSASSFFTSTSFVYCFYLWRWCVKSYRRSIWCTIVSNITAFDTGYEYVILYRVIISFTGGYVFA